LIQINAVGGIGTGPSSLDQPTLRRGDFGRVSFDRSRQREVFVVLRRVSGAMTIDRLARAQAHRRPGKKGHAEARNRRKEEGKPPRRKGAKDLL